MKGKKQKAYEAKTLSNLCSYAFFHGIEFVGRAVYSHDFYLPTKKAAQEFIKLASKVDNATVKWDRRKKVVTLVLVEEE